VEAEGAGETRAGVVEAWQMVDLFASLEVPAFDLTTTDVDGRKRGFRRAVSGAALRQEMPDLLDAAIQRQQNLIVRPRDGRVALIQLDDLSGAMLEIVRAAAFMILATSAGNHQAWVAVVESKAGFARRLRHASAADPCASGATRVAGSVNFKRRYAPEFPTVRLLEGHPHRTVTEAELETFGLVAGREAEVRHATRWPPSRQPRAWPSYECCLQNAPCARGSNRPDVSRADFTFCLLAMDWGWSPGATIERLLDNSRKARENGTAYALRTVERAAAALGRRSAAVSHLP
jgi:RepB DNA-primase from phage plasmid